MNTIDLTELIPRCHEASKANGWWEPRPNFGQQLMLASGELAESQEAHRSHRQHRMKPELLRAWILLFEAGDETMPERFKKWIKDTVQDELADTYIRLCDFIAGFSLPMPSGSEFTEARAESAFEPNENFGEALMQLNSTISKAYDAMKYVLNFEAAGYHLATVLVGIEALCRKEGFDLAAQIDLKLQYNQSRGHKHGGKAY